MENVENFGYAKQVFDEMSEKKLISSTVLLSKTFFLRKDALYVADIYDCLDLWILKNVNIGVVWEAAKG